MELNFNGDEVADLIGAAERIMLVIGYAQGRADSYAARRADFKIIDFANLKAQHDSEMKARAETSFYSEEEIKRMPKLKEGRFRKTRDGLWQVRYRRDGYDIQFTCKDKNTVLDRFRDWVKSVNGDRKESLPKKSNFL